MLLNSARVPYLHLAVFEPRKKEGRVPARVKLHAPDRHRRAMTPTEGRKHTFLKSRAQIPELDRRVGAQLDGELDLLMDEGALLPLRCSLPATAAAAWHECASIRGSAT